MPELFEEFIETLKNKRIAIRMMTRNQRMIYKLISGITAPLSLICLFVTFHGHFLLGLLGFAAAGTVLSQADEIALMLKNQGMRISCGGCTLEHLAADIAHRMPGGWRMERHPNELLFLQKQTGRIMSVRHGGDYMYLSYSDPSPHVPDPEAFADMRKAAEQVIDQNWTRFFS